MNTYNNSLANNKVISFLFLLETQKHPFPYVIFLQGTSWGIWPGEGILQSSTFNIGLDWAGKE